MSQQGILLLHQPSRTWPRRARRRLRRALRLAFADSMSTVSWLSMPVGMSTAFRLEMRPILPARIVPAYPPL